MKTATNIIGREVFCHIVGQNFIELKFGWRDLPSMPLMTGMSDIYITDISNECEELECIYD